MYIAVWYMKEVGGGGRDRGREEDSGSMHFLSNLPDCYLITITTYRLQPGLPPFDNSHFNFAV